MDDPWGSPWATDADSPSKNTQLAKSPPKSSTLEPPPRAILSTSPPKQSLSSSFTSNSPWADDGDGFGDWSSPSPAPTPGASASTGWGGWAASEGSAASSEQQLTPIPRDTMFGSASPIAWPGSIATAASPSLSPPKRAADSSSLRQPSPDPWASDFALSREELAHDKPFAKAKDSTDAKTKAETGDDDAVDVQEESEVPTITLAADGNDLGLPPQKEDDIPDWEAAESEVDVRRGRTEQSRRLSGTQDAPAPPTEDGSRPSSSGSDGSHDNERGQDSPITSIDEDSKTRPQLQQRKVSSKIQDIVHMYDDLGRKIDSEDANLAERAAKSRERSHDSRTRRGGTDEVADDDDFGGFEDVVPAEESVDEATKLPVVKTRGVKPEQPMKRPSTPHSRTGSIQTPVGTPGSLSSPATHQAISSAFKDLLAKYGPVSYTSDLSLITQLFPDLPALPKTEESQPTAPFYVPDHIIDDSFTTISERKTWYRISRQGSSRRHDIGAEDNNYRRITWPVSTVRDDTIKIVRRWMEEDSFSGRATLGGTGSKIKGNVFGWDSSAEPVGLDEVFKKRSSLPAQRRSEFALAPPFPETNVAVNGGQAVQQPTYHPGPEQSATLAPSLASFGAQATQQPIVKGPIARLTATRPVSLPPHAFNAPVIKAEPLAASASPVSADVDDDDDWGEMMSSPQDTSFPSGGPMSALDELTKPIAVVPSSTGSAQQGSSQMSNVPFSGSSQGSTQQPPNNDFAAMDFSIFEYPAPTIQTQPGPVIQKTMVPTSQSRPAAALAEVNTARSQTGSMSEEDDVLVKDILSKLPNLSYMLR